MRDRRALPPIDLARLPIVDRWWSAVSSGRFYTWWSAIVALPVAATVLGSFGGVTRPGQAVAAVALSTLGWLLCCLLILPAAWAERRIPSPAGRATVVLGALVVVCVLRPLLNDLLVSWWSPRDVDGALGLRILINLIAWFALLSMVAVAVNATATATGVNRRLRAALAALEGGSERDEGDARRARARIHLTVEELRRRAEALRTGVVDFDRVREFSEAVRDASHDLDERADTDAVAAGAAARPSFLAWLRPPPVGLIGAVFTFGSLPFALSVMPLWLVALAAVVALGIPTLGDAVSRVLSRGRTPTAQGIIVLAVSVAEGVLLSLVFLPEFGSLGVEWVIPIVMVPGITILAAVAEGAVERAESEQLSLTQALSAFRAADAGTPASAADLLRHAADTLHGEVQSRCVVFAAMLDDEPATPEQTAEFLSAIGVRLDHVIAPPAPVDGDALATLIAAWSPVLDIHCDIDEESARALTDPDTARRVADVTSEAFVNAVKHSAAREATVVVQQAAPGILAARIAAPGRLRSTRSGGLGLARLAVPARLSQRGTDVVLAAAVPFRDTRAGEAPA